MLVCVALWEGHLNFLLGNDFVRSTRGFWLGTQKEQIETHNHLKGALEIIYTSTRAYQLVSHGLIVTQHGLGRWPIRHSA